MSIEPSELVDFARRRKNMVARQIAGRGIHSRLVLDAMGRVPRERYVRPDLRDSAYDDRPLPIEERQTISQPYIVAFMIAALDLEGGERVLDVGTGSGYAAAVLAEIASQVWTIERHGGLADSARQRLCEDGYTGVEVRDGDGTLGWPDAAPFDAILVSASGPDVPASLRDQLAIGGRLVIPVGVTLDDQRLVRITRVEADRFVEEDLVGVRFVQLIGEEGW